MTLDELTILAAAKGYKPKWSAPECRYVLERIPQPYDLLPLAKVISETPDATLPPIHREPLWRFNWDTAA